MSIKRVHGRDTLFPFRLEATGYGDRPVRADRPRFRAAQRIKGSIDHMLRNLGKPLRVSTLSSIAGYSSSHFLTLFKSATGYPPKEFFIHLRIHRACLMLARAARVKEVAAALGYDDQFYFSRQFKSVLGIAPRDYRQKLSGAPGNRRRPAKVDGARKGTAAFKVPSWMQLA